MDRQKYSFNIIKGVAAAFLQFTCLIKTHLHNKCKFQFIEDLPTWHVIGTTSTKLVKLLSAQVDSWIFHTRNMRQIYGLFC